MYRIKYFRRIVSVFLVLTVMLGLVVPFEISVYAEDTETGGQIYALLYDTRPNHTGSHWDGYELVFQNGNTPDSETANRKCIRTYAYSQFADTQHGSETPWYTEKEGGYSYAKYINSVVFKDKIAPESISGWFRDFYRINGSSFKNIENLDLSNCVDISYAFASSAIDRLDLSFADVSKVEDANHCFSSCGSLTNLNISTWELPEVTTLNCFFEFCRKLESVDLTGLNPVKCRNCGFMFRECNELKNLKFGKFEAGNYYTSSPRQDIQGEDRVSFQCMFYNCTSLETLDLSSWNIKNPYTYQQMFDGCTALESVDISGLTGYTTWGNWEHRYMFRNCTSLQSLDFYGASLPFAASGVFKNCKSLKQLDLSKVGFPYHVNNSWWWTSTLKESENIFEGVGELSEVTLNQYWPKSDKIGSSIPSEKNWIKIKQPSDYTGNEALYPLYGATLSSAELFGDFHEGYAGTWVAVSKITLNANGGTPTQQAIEGSRGMPLKYSESDITTPVRNGYKCSSAGFLKRRTARALNSKTVKQPNHGLTMLTGNRLLTTSFSTVMNLPMKQKQTPRLNTMNS